MIIRSIPPEFDPETVSAIDTALSGIVEHDHVAMPWAIESGSRAWGFPSPDSDYDCRFIYVRRHQDYLTPWPMRDVIELPLNGVLDINGWDLAKALQLLVKGNAVVTEWLQSPIAYRGDPWFRSALLSLAERVIDQDAIMRHYYHLGKLQWDAINRKGDGAKLKKLFYALRPAMALLWIRENPSGAVLPMNLFAMMEQCSLDGALRSAILQLIEEKAKTKEMGLGAAPPIIAAFIDQQFSMPLISTRRGLSVETAKQEAAELFREAIRRFGQ